MRHEVPIFDICLDSSGNGRSSSSRLCSLLGMLSLLVFMSREGHMKSNYGRIAGSGLTQCVRRLNLLNNSRAPGRG